MNIGHFKNDDLNYRISKKQKTKNENKKKPTHNNTHPYSLIGKKKY